MQVCPSCGEDNSDRARFCQACAAPLGTPLGARGEVRKTVTVVFTDVSGSTAIGEKLDPESLRRLMSRYFDSMRSVLERHGGTVEKFIGDAIMAVFGIPQLHEDDAIRAVRAAAEMRKRLAELNADLRRDFGVEIASRTGVNTGAVVAGDPSTGSTLVTGDAVNTAARLEQAAPVGEVLISQDTYRLVRDAVVAEPAEPVAAKGKAEPIPAYRLIKVIPGAEPHVRRLDAPMVGRDRELALILGAFEHAVAERVCRLVTILGEAGVGKSRLVLEAIHRLEARATVLRGRCLPYGEGITYWPIAEAVRQAAGVSDERSPDEAKARIAQLLPEDAQSNRIADRVAGLIGIGEEIGTAEEGFWAVRRFLEGLAQTRPLVLVFDDIHWAEETFLDLIRYVLEWTSGVPILLLSLARRDLLDRRPDWAASGPKARLVALDPLRESECESMLGSLLGTDEVPQAVSAVIAGAAEGNPLFVEEMLSMLIDDGLLVRDNGRWVPTSDLAGISAPPTVQALLAARLERLDEGERRVLERASVVGEVFDWQSMSELSPPESRPRLGGALMSLVRKELIRPAASDFSGEDAFRFRHILIRDAAYDAMPKGARASLHERFAQWLERAAGERLAEVREIVGFHLERAYRYREQLGTLADAAQDLSLEAARHLREAGKRALARADMHGAANLLGRALGLLPAGDALRPELMLELIHALREVGEFGRVGELVEDGREAARVMGARGLELRFEVWRLFLRVMIEPKSTVFREIIEAANAIAAEAEEIGDPVTQGEALLRVGRLLSDIGRTVDGERTVARASRCLQRAGVPSAELAFVMFANYTGQGPHPAAERAAQGARELVRSEEGSPSEAFILLGLATNRAMLGGFDDARSFLQRGAAILHELGMTVEVAASVGLCGAVVEMLSGAPAAAETAIRPGYDTLKGMGEKGRLCTRAAFLARIAYERGRYDEASDLADEADSGSAIDDIEPQIWLRGVRAKVLARRGRIDEAEREARENVDLAERTDWLDFQGTAWWDLCEVLRIARRSQEAAEAARLAATRFEAKGNVVMTARAEALQSELAAADP